MTISLPFAASDVENVEMYHYVVPASAEKKIITQADAISELYAVFSELPVSDRKTEPVASGSTFRIIQAMKLFIAQRLLRKAD